MGVKVWKKSTAEKKIIMVLWALLAVEFIFLAVANLSLQIERMDDDSADMYVHIMEMWRNRRLFIPGWFYASTLELDCASFFALPLYAVTGNIFLAYGISNILFMALLIWVLFQVFHGKSAIYPLASAVLLLLPYKTGMLDYVNMLFVNGSQYIIKIMLPFLLVAILIRAEEGKHRAGKSEIALWVLYGVFLFLTGCSSGAYVLVCGLFPVFAGFFVYKLASGGRILFQYWIYGMVTVALAVTGIAVNMLMKPETRGLQMNLIGIREMSFSDNFFAIILGIYELFGGVAYQNIPVMSFQGINVLIRMGYVFLLLGVTVCAIWRALRGKGNLRSAMFSAMFVWNLFILLVCDTRYGASTSEYRYHLMGMVPVMCLAAEKFVDLWWGGSKQTIAFLWRRGFISFVGRYIGSHFL